MVVIYYKEHLFERINTLPLLLMQTLDQKGVRAVVIFTLHQLGVVELMEGFGMHIFIDMRNGIYGSVEMLFLNENEDF
jgi:hypothetical protein